ncbi:sirohydrochlorin chelatase [Streptomyces argenteolus]|uniref:Sirohydrochlorin chelatase n=1 Tax=Streptomyces argenteolus TaxID=67274 RepID=A0ABW6XBN7_9ACTN
MRDPVGLVVAHGSRDPRHAATVHALTTLARTLRPGLRIETAFLALGTPSVPRVLERLASEGVREVVVVPLLLTRAFHSESDLPAALRRAPPALRVVQADVLGPSPLLLTALQRRLEEAGLGPGGPPSTGLVLASAGSTAPEASAVIADVTRELRQTGWCAVRPAFASGPLPRTADVVRALRADGVHRVAVAPYMIAPGRLADRVLLGAREAGAEVVAPVLGAAPELARLLVDRWEAGATGHAEAGRPTEADGRGEAARTPAGAPISPSSGGRHPGVFA